MNTPDWLLSSEKRKKRWWRGCRRRAIGCLVFFILALVLLCSLFFVLARPAKAQSVSDSLTIWLLIDNSHSMFERNGRGSDPDLLRLDAARLFISYLGVDRSDTVHRCGVIFFGTEAEIQVPLTPLADDQQRAELFSQLNDPPRMGWTDHLAALDLAYEQIEQDGGANPALVLLTDGKPEWGSTPTAAEQAAYINALENMQERLTAAAIPLFIVLLANPTTEADSELTDIWQPIWEEMAAVTTPGQLYVAQEATDLVAIYHDVVLTLTGGTSDGAVTQNTFDTLETTQYIAVEAHLKRMTLVISKSNPGIVVSVMSPDGQPLTPTVPGVRFASQPGSREEIWTIDAPMPGQWLVQMRGAGFVTVWKDYEVLPVTVTPPLVATPTASVGTTIPVSQVPTVVPSRTPEAGISVTVTIPTKGLHSKTFASFAHVVAFPWLWLLPLGLLLAAATYGVGQRWGRSDLVVTGTVRILAGPGTAEGQMSVELDSLGRREITIGAAPADIPLPEAGGRVRLRSATNDVMPLFIEGEGQTWLNEEPLTTIRHLNDAMLITIGLAPQPVYRLRYENLRLRSALREAEMAHFPSY